MPLGENLDAAAGLRSLACHVPANLPAPAFRAVTKTQFAAERRLVQGVPAEFGGLFLGQASLGDEIGQSVVDPPQSLGH